MRLPIGIVSAFLAAGFGAFAQQYTLSTVAGGSPPPTNVAALTAPIGSPGAVTADPAGNIYFVSTNCVFKVDLNGTLTRVAGNSRVGFSGDGGAATQAQLSNPGGVAADNAGNLYISDSSNNRIRKVTLATGVITTIAGTGTASFSGDSGAAATATLNNPQGLAVDTGGNLYIADAGNHAVRKIAANGVITTVAGNGTPGASGDGQAATIAQLNSPMGVAVDTGLNIYISDSNNHRIRVVRNSLIPGAPPQISTIIGNGIPGFQGDNGLATGAELNYPTAIAVDSAGTVYIDDFNNGRVRKVVNGIINTVTGGSPVKTPAGIAVDPSSNLYVTDSSLAQILRFTSGGSLSFFAGTGVRYYLGDGGPATSSQLVHPEGLAVDPNGIYIADRAELAIRKISQTATISSPAGASGLLGPGGVAVDLAGNIYVADTVGNQVLKILPNGNRVLVAGIGSAGSFGDNGTATAAQLNQPGGIAVDLAGSTVYIADTGNNRIRKVTVSTGIITTIAGTGAASFGGDNGVATSAPLNQPNGVAIDSAGNVFIADTGNNRIRKVSAAGIITTVAGNGNNSSSGDGGPAVNAAISSPHGISVDTQGNLYIPDFAARVRKVSTSGIIITIAGNGTPGYSGDNGPALSGQLSMPWGIVVNGDGYIYVSDVGEMAVRELSPLPISQPTILTASPLPSGVVGQPYGQALSASGGTAPYTWSITAGTLPTGLTLSPAGSITGTPTVSGSYVVFVQVTDSFLVSSQVMAIVIPIAPTGPAGLRITTPATLVPGAVGVSYSQTLTATDGNAPYTWTLTSGALPAGLTLFPSGQIFGTPQTAGTSTFTVRVNDNSGAVANQSFTLTVISVGSLTRTGVLGHIAVGGGWTTRAYLTNISTSPVALNLVVHADDGSTTTNLPFSVTQQGSTQQLSGTSLNGVLNPNTTMVIDGGAQSGTLFSGWIDVLSSGTPTSLAGFAIFRTVALNGTTSEGTSPLQTVFEPKMYLPFDDTGGFLTAVAITNPSTTPTTVTASVLDANGLPIGTYSFQLQANGHTSFVLPDKFAVTANQQGIVQFQNTSGGSLSGVGLRASTTSGTFTSIPIILP